MRCRDIFEQSELSRFFTVNRDIFLRTLFLVAVNFYFLSAGASQGAVVLAVNTLLMQFFTLFSYVMDGFAYAGEALCGRLYGAGNNEGFVRMVRRLFIRSPHTAAIVPETRPRVNREDEVRFTGPIVFCYTTQSTQGSTCQHGLRSECCDG